MILEVQKKQGDLRKQQEARNFIGRKGSAYIKNLATSEEKAYFEGIIYNSGIPDLASISSITAY